jgi:transcriptional regulator with XRE-family HTH domain
MSYTFNMTKLAGRQKKLGLSLMYISQKLGIHRRTLAEIQRGVRKGMMWEQVQAYSACLGFDLTFCRWMAMDEEWVPEKKEEKGLCRFAVARPNDGRCDEPEDE